ncbi:ubiquitin carboxyl-terminal hydrolase CYLD-like, partial [Scyliorhinus canicula]|uniref:ubiquitin carboxyl-terminal hydrolase CYLD-like n=1 Tax=Scyliorhinus canicula TaxID=7830 RepID=UPI0018F570AF
GGWSDRPSSFWRGVSDPEKRLALSANGPWLAWAGGLTPGTRVRVRMSSSSEEWAQGVVRYRGPVSKHSGVYFGIEFLGADSRKGYTDGLWNKKRFFSCAENGGVFVAACRLEPDEEARVQGRAGGDPCRSELTGRQAPALQPGSRVYFKQAGTLRFGQVKYCGACSGKAEGGVYVGIQLDCPVGNWDGWVDGRQLCTITDPDYGILLPLRDVHPVSDRENKITAPESLRHPTLDDKETSPFKLKEDQMRRGGSHSLTGLVSEPYGVWSSVPSEKGRRGLPLEVESMVEVNSPPLYGVIRWIGEVPTQTETLAGLEMEVALQTGCTDGTYCGRRYFRCPPNKALFVKLKTCRPDSRFHSLSPSGNPVERFNSLDFKNCNSPRVRENTPPEKGRAAMDVIQGWRKGIQGHCNSCYLDATLFCMFAFNSVLDTLLLRPRATDDSELYSETRDLLRTEIVNPLRRDGYVSATKVMALRKILEGAGSSTGFTSEEKDPEEFLNQLFQLLKTEPLLKIRAGRQEPQDCTSHQIFFQDKGSIRIPTVQKLLELSFQHSDLKLTEAPSCLILQMPRFGKNFKMFDLVLPTLELNITDLLEDTPRECRICGQLAYVECRECYKDPDLAPGKVKQFCVACSEQVHRHLTRKNHNPCPVLLPEELRGKVEFPGIIPQQTMQLFAVLCIQTSHYVAFVKHGTGDDHWLFFDSMADREGGQNGFNIPRVEQCPEVADYLAMKPEDLEAMDPKAIPSSARRLLLDASMCFYYSQSLCLYK